MIYKVVVIGVLLLSFHILPIFAGARWSDEYVLVEKTPLCIEAEGTVVAILGDGTVKEQGKEKRFCRFPDGSICYIIDLFETCREGEYRRVSIPSDYQSTEIGFEDAQDILVYTRMNWENISRKEMISTHWRLLEQIQKAKMESFDVGYRRGQESALWKVALGAFILYAVILIIKMIKDKKII